MKTSLLVRTDAPPRPSFASAGRREGQRSSGGAPVTVAHVLSEPGLGHDFSRVRVRAGDEREADLMLRTPGVGAPSPSSRIRTFSRAPLSIQRQQAAQAPPDPLAAERAEFERAQARFFEEVGEIIRDEILKRAGFAAGTQPANADEALRVVSLWGLTIDDLVAKMPQLEQSLSGQVTGQHTDTGLEQKQQSLISALTPAGQQAYDAALSRVKKEAFWQEYIATHTIYILPDLKGTNRYSGYTQRGTARDPSGKESPVYIIHISKDQLEAGDTDAVVSVLIHELSHTAYEPVEVTEAMRPFLNSLSELLADHPKVAALRSSAPDPAAARQAQVRRISQLLYEQTGYAQAEIFVHLQQLTHQPAVTIQGEKVRGSDYILAVVEHYLEQLKRIGLPPRMLLGILDATARRVEILYDRRIAAAPAGSRERELLRINKDLATSLLRLARSSTGTER